MRPAYEAMSLASKISEAFSSRTRPEAVIESHAPGTDEYSDAQAFAGREWRELSEDDWREHSAAIFGLSPEAFRYYLPSILHLSVSSNHVDMLGIDALIGMLDRSNTPSSWDQFFRERWTGFTPAEYQVLQEWLIWLSSEPGMKFASQRLGRASDTVSILANAGDPG